MAQLRRSVGLLLVLVFLGGLLGLPVAAQVVPPGNTGGGNASGFPETLCVNTVGVGLTASGVLQCAPVTPAMTTGLVPAGQDVSSTGQVIATHLAGPLPLPQGGLGLSSGTSGGLLFFSSTTSLAVTGSLPQNAPLLGGGPGEGPAVGTRSGTTLEFGTILGPHTVNKQLTFDPNGNIVASASDIGGGTGTVVSVFGRSGTVIAATGDYTVSQVTNAASLTSANAFTNPAGQSMPQLVLTGSVSGTLALRAPAGAGTSLLTWPAGTTDFSATGGPGQVVRQSTVGGAFFVGQLALSDLLGAGGVCTSATLCPGYQAALGFPPEDSTNKSSNVALGTSTVLYPSQSAVKSYVDTQVATKQNTLGFAPEDLANKASGVTLGTSNTLYPTQGAVKSYVDTQVATKQNTLAFTPENVALKSTDPALGTSATLYPSQGAVKAYADAGLSTKQNTLAFTPEDVARKSTDGGLGTSTTLYPSQSAVKTYVDAAVLTRQAPITWGAGLTYSGTTASVTSSQTGFLANGGGVNLACGVSASGRMQVLATGELQYCDGATTSMLQSGFLTQAGLKWQVIPGSCTGDTNGGKLTVTLAGNIVCASDIGGGGTGGGVTSVFGRTGVVAPASGDYAASQVTNAADVAAANIFTHPSGQSMARVILLGATSGSLTQRVPASAGSSTITWPVGVTDFSATGGAGQVLRQSGVGAALTVGTLAVSDLAGGNAVCTTTTVCTGYQASLTFTPEDTANKNISTALGTSNVFYPTQNAVKVYVDTGLATKQATLAFTPEDVARKSTLTTLGTSDTLYPSQNAVKVYVDTGLAGKQNSLGFTAENVGNKAPSTALGTSDTLYPTQNAVKVYVDTADAGKQPLVTWGAGLAFSAGTASVASTEAGFLTNGGATGLTCGAGASGKMQVLNTGEIQYCDGAGTSALRSGFFTQSGLTWNVTLTACTTDANEGKLTVNGTGQIICRPDQGVATLAFSALTAGTVLSQALLVGGGATLGPTGGGIVTANALTGTLTIGSGSSLGLTGTGTLTANLLTGTPTIGSGSTLGPTGTGVLTANALTGAPTIGSGSTLGPTGTGVLTANALTGIVVVGAASSLSASGGGSITATALVGIPDLSALLTATSTHKVFNKQNVPRVVALSASGSPLTVNPAPNCDTGDIFTLDAIAGDLTIPAPVCTGTNPESEQEVELRLRSSTPRVLTWNPAYCEENNVPLLAATTGDGVKFNRIKFRRNSLTSCWGVIANPSALARGLTAVPSSATYTCDPRLAESCEQTNTLTAGTGVTLGITAGTYANGTKLLMRIRCTGTQALTLPTGTFQGSATVPLTGMSCTSNAYWTQLGFIFSGADSRWQIYAFSN
jgi:hypothetical protein